MMQAGRRFPRPSAPFRGGAGLLGHAPPGYGPPGGVPHPHPGASPTGVPPPSMPGGAPSVQHSGFPRGPPPGVPPVMSQSNNLPQQHGTGMTSPIPGAVPPRMGLLGHQPNSLPPQSPHQQQQQQIPGFQQQQTGKSTLSIPGVENAFGGDADAALALVSQILKERGLGQGTASGNLGTPNPQGIANQVGATSTVLPNLNFPPPPISNNNSAQITNLPNNQPVQHQPQQTNFANAMSTMTGMNSMLQQQQQHAQYNGTTGGSAMSGVSSMGGLLGSTSITSSPGLNIPGTMQTSSPYSNTNQGLLNAPDIQSPPPSQIPPTGNNSIKQPLLSFPPGMNPAGIPPPNHAHASAHGGVRPPNHTPNMYAQDPNQLAADPQTLSNTINGQRQGGLLGTAPGLPTAPGGATGGVRPGVFHGSTAHQQQQPPPSLNNPAVYRQPRSYNQHYSPYQGRSPGRKDYRTGGEYRSDSRSSRDSASPRDSSGKGKTSGLKSEEYDPAEPTEDNQNENAGFSRGSSKRHRSPTPLGTSPHRGSPHGSLGGSTSDLTVTITGKDRYVSQDGGPNAKRHNSGGVKTNENGQFHCHACNMDAANLQEFDRHMRSEQHLQQLENMSTLLPQQIDRELQRMKAEEHIKRCEGKDLQDYCRICDKRFPNKIPGASFITHRRSQEHRRKERLTKRGCKLCDTGSFHQYPEYVKHIDSEPHKKKKELLRKNNETCGSSRSSVGGSSISGSLAGDDDTESNMDGGSTLGDPLSDPLGDPLGGDPAADHDLLDGFPDNIDDMVTVDATGIYGEEDEEMSLENRSARVSPSARLQPPVPSLPGLVDPPAAQGGNLEALHPGGDKPVSREVEENAPWKLKSESSDSESTEPQVQLSLAQASKASSVTTTISSNKHQTTSPCAVSSTSFSSSSSTSASASSAVFTSSTSSSSVLSSIDTVLNISGAELKPKIAPKLVDPSSLKYDGQSPVGVEQIVPVRGFFCKICLKFYHDEQKAKVTHCQSATHFEEYQKYLRKEMNNAKLSLPVIPNGQYKLESQTFINNNIINNTMNTGQKALHTNNKLTLQQGGVVVNNIPKAQRINLTSKTLSSLSTSPVKENTVLPINTDPLVCKNTPPVKRTIQVKPDHDIKVDINANSDLDDEKPKLNGDSDVLDILLNPLNNNDEDSVDNELELLSNGGVGDDDLFDSSLEDSSPAAADSVKSVTRGRSTRSSRSRVKTKKSRAK